MYKLNKTILLNKRYKKNISRRFLLPKSFKFTVRDKLLNGDTK